MKDAKGKLHKKEREIQQDREREKKKDIEREEERVGREKKMSRCRQISTASKRIVIET